MNTPYKEHFTKDSFVASNETGWPVHPANHFSICLLKEHCLNVAIIGLKQTIGRQRSGFKFVS
jgi:hypothetical protein